MKLIFALLLACSSVFADSDDLLNCQTEQYAGALSVSAEQQGNLSYLYTTGRIICPASVEYFIKDKVDFRCVGLWDFDPIHNEGEVRGEPLTVEFKFDGEKYMATLKANNVHHNEIIKMKCGH